MHNFIGNLMQFTKLQYLKKEMRYVCTTVQRGVFYLHKPSFLMHARS